MQKKWIQWLILLILVLTWGSSFILMKKGLVVFSALEVGALRIALTFLFLLPFAFFRLHRIKLNQWYRFFICGAIGSGIPAFLFAYAQTGIDSSLSGILNSLTPLFTLILGLLFFKFHTRWYQVVGVFIGLTGACGLVAISGSGNIEWNFSYAIYIIIATILYAININLIKTWFSDTDSVSISTYTISFIGIPVIIYLLFFTGFTETMQTKSGAWQAFSMIAILAVVGTGIALMLYNHLIKISNIVFASSVTYMIPVIAILWGVLDGESFNLVNVLWILLVLSGVLMVNNPFEKKAPAKKTDPVSPVKFNKPTATIRKD